MREIRDEQGRKICASCLYLIEEQPEFGCKDCGYEVSA